MTITYNPLWKTLVDRNMNKEDLRKLTNISPSTMAKMSKDEYVALRVIDDICEALQVNTISSVVEYVEQGFQLNIYDNLEASNPLETLEKTVNSIIVRMENNNYRITVKDQKTIYDLSVSVINDLANNPDEQSVYEYIQIYLKILDYKLLSGGYALNLIQMLSLIERKFK